MTTPFLTQAAGHIFEKYSADLDKLVVLLPTKRSCFFFKKALAAQAESPVWSPKIMTIDDFIAEVSHLQPIDPIELLWLLYEVFKKHDPQLEFERFTSWAYTLLADFDKLDQFLVDASQLFDYLAEAKALDRWELAPSVVAMPKTQILSNYFKLWDNLDKVYVELKDKLLARGQGYRGMMYRWVAENTHILTQNPDVKQYLFVGLNALSLSEEKIIQKLIKTDKAEMLWDADSYYLQANPAAKAGEQLRRYKKSGKYGREWNWESDNLLTAHKDFHFIGVPNASMQSKVASQIFRQTRREISVADPSLRTAVVLPDENLLLPVLHALDEDLDDFNITMGLSVRNSALYSLINLLFEVQQMTAVETGNNGSRLWKFNCRSLTKVLTHPFIRQYEMLFLNEKNTQATIFEEEKLPKNFIRHTLRQIQEHQWIYISPDKLFELSNQHDLFKTLFKPWTGKPENALRCFYQLIDLLRDVYKNQKDAIETEYLFLFYTFVQRLENIVRLSQSQSQPDSEPLTLRSFRLFLNELFRQTKIPFGGEPEGGLQIMGMLETRTLDFERVIFLSCNEGTFPQPKRQNSLIPFDANREFGMPTYQAQEATISYHFYRLLQRADEVYFLHVLPSDTYGAGEKSRFLQQIENELIQLNPNIRLHHSTAVSPEMPEEDEPVTLRVEKNAAVLQKIKEVLERGVTPSQLNLYAECTLKYYFSTVAKVREAEEADPTLGAGMFGQMVHKTLEEIDRELTENKKTIEAEEVRSVIPQLSQRLKVIFERDFPAYSLEKGMNYLYFKVAVRLLTNLLEYQLEQNRFPVEILLIEEEIKTDFLLDNNGETIEVVFKGRIDRIERSGSQVRIVDYKTGKVEAKDLKNGSSYEDQLLLDPKADKLRQLWLYKYLVTKHLLSNSETPLLHPGDTVTAGVYSLRNLAAGFLQENLVFEEDSPAFFVRQSEIWLRQILTRILDTNLFFEQTQKLETCKLCAYKKICDRE
jgi:ATP-dependent helicase/nuclease subunit B